VILLNIQQFFYTELTNHKGEIMTRPIRIEMDCSTGIESIIELTDEEIAQLEAVRAEALAKKAADEEAAQALAAIKESAKAKLVAGEPLTEEEAATIVL
jgi:formylmethanofuran dehydrogenase subunit B